MATVESAALTVSYEAQTTCGSRLRGFGALIERSGMKDTGYDHQ